MADRSQFELVPNWASAGFAWHCNECNTNTITITAHPPKFCANMECPSRPDTLSSLGFKTSPWSPFECPVCGKHDTVLYGKMYVESTTFHCNSCGHRYEVDDAQFQRPALGALSESRDRTDRLHHNEPTGLRDGIDHQVREPAPSEGRPVGSGEGSVVSPEIDEGGVRRLLPFRTVNGARSIRYALEALGIDTTEENFQDTPTRFAQFLASHFPTQEEVEAKLLELKRATFPTKYKGMISVSNIAVHGMCPHHLLPVAYKIAIAYIPDERVLGLSKLPRLAELFGSQASLQEDVTQNIVDALASLVPNLGAIVVVEGLHSCMAIRGVKLDDSVTVTSAVTGVFLDESKGARNEFLALTRGGQHA